MLNTALAYLIALAVFRLRRLPKVNTEALLTAAGQNLKRLLRRRGWGRRPWPGGPAGHRFRAYPHPKALPVGTAPARGAADPRLRCLTSATFAMTSGFSTPWRS